MSQRRLFLAGLALAACTGAFAQATKPIRLIVPYAPGGCPTWRRCARVDAK